LMMVMEGQMGSEQYIPLKTGKFIMKWFELCASSTAYSW
jgi:hypothetical protein